MESDFYDYFISSVLTISGGAIGYFIKYLIDLKNEKNLKVYAERRELYQNFVALIVSLNSENAEISESFRVKLNDFYSKYILYASPDVMNSFSKFIALLNSRDMHKISNEFHDALSQVMLDMRKDLGLGNKKLANKGRDILNPLNFH
ncbi:MAG TPA: hypothetical protein VK151_02165 [Fluviicola sp.]|nr:hypothetical protein [Fluviicola sp.]